MRCLPFDARANRYSQPFSRYLYDVSVAGAHRAVVVDAQVLQRLHQPTLRTHAHAHTQAHTRAQSSERASSAQASKQAKNANN